MCGWLAQIRDDDRQDADVIALCKEENAHCKEALKDTEVCSGDNVQLPYRSSRT
jgi:hypothetical protein